jgi:hypothetical protein
VGELANGGAWVFGRPGAEPSLFDPDSPPRCVSANMRYSGKVGGLSFDGATLVERVEPFGAPGPTCVLVETKTRAARAIPCPATLAPPAPATEWRSDGGHVVRIETGDKDWSTTTLRELDADGKKIGSLDLGEKAVLAGSLDGSRLVFVVRSTRIGGYQHPAGDVVIVATSPPRLDATIEPPLCVPPPAAKAACPR